MLPQICPLPMHLKHFMFLISVLDDEVELCLVPQLGVADFTYGDCDRLDKLPPSFLGFVGLVLVEGVG